MTRLPWRQPAFLAAVTLLVFSPSLAAEFVYDARLQILTDPFLFDSGNWLDVLTFRVLGRDVLDFNRPVQLASLMLDAAVWGREPFGFHLTSIVLHAGNVVLVWAVIRRLLAADDGGGGLAGGGRDLVAPLAALLFAVHPLVTEAVCEPTFREDLLAAALSLGAVFVSLVAGGGAARWPAAACAACCLLAVASKESGVAAPLVVAVSGWVFYRFRPRSFWVVAAGGGLLLVTLFLIARFALEPPESMIFESRPGYPGGSFLAALAILPRILALYLQLIVLPVNQSADYGLVSVRHLPLLVALLVIVAFAAPLVRAARRDPRIWFGLALFALPLLPVANLVPIYRAAADRYLYLPLAGVACLAACLLDSPWLRARDGRRQAALVAAGLAAAVLAAACVERQRVWADSLALWGDTARRNPASYTAVHGLAGALHEAGRHQEAERAAREAIRVSREQRGEAFVTLALVQDALGRRDDAEAALRRALELEPRLANPAGRVAALAMEGSEAERLTDLLRRYPQAIPPEAAGLGLPVD